MFHAKRARQDQGADNPIDGSSAAQSALGQPTEHLPSSSSPGQPVTVHGRAAARNILVRPGLLLLALAAVTILGGVLVAAASATTQDMGARQAEHASPTAGLPERLAQTTQTTQTNQARDQPPLIPARALVQLVLDPAQAAIGPGERQAYTAKVLIQLGPRQAYTAEKPDTYSYSFDVTRLTRFKIIPDGSCTKGKVSCSATDIGPHTVTGILPPAPECHTASVGRRCCTWTGRLTAWTSSQRPPPPSLGTIRSSAPSPETAAAPSVGRRSCGCCPGSRASHQSRPPPRSPEGRWRFAATPAPATAQERSPSTA